MERSRGDIVRAALHLPMLQAELDICDGPLQKLPKEIHSESFLPLSHPGAYSCYQPSTATHPNIGTLNYTPLVMEVAADIIESTRTCPVTCIVGDKGSGKSTFVPHLLMRSYPNTRIYIVSAYESSAALLAHRLCSDRSLSLGIDVGIHTGVYGQAQVMVTTPIVVCTPEVMVRRLHNRCDSSLTKAMMIIDDLQERHPYTDLLLLLARQLANRSHHIVLMTGLVESSSFLKKLQSYFEGTAQGSFRIVTAPKRTVVCDFRSEDLVRAVGRIHGADGNEDAMEDDVTVLSSLNCNTQLLTDVGIVPLVTALHNELEINQGAIIVLLPSSHDCVGALYALRRQYTARPISVHVLHEGSTSEEALSTLQGLPDGARRVLLCTHPMAHVSVNLYGRCAALIDCGRRCIARYDPLEDTTWTEHVWITQDQYLCGLQFLTACNWGAGEGTAPPLHIMFMMASQMQELLKTEPFSCAEQRFLPAPVQYSNCIADIVLNIYLLSDIILQANVERVLGQMISPPDVAALDIVVLSLERQSLINAKRVITSFGIVVAHLAVGITQGRFLLYGLCFGVLRPLAVTAAVFTVGYPGADIEGSLPGGCEAVALSALMSQYLREDDRQAFCALRNLSYQTMQRIATVVRALEKVLSDCALLRGESHNIHGEDIEIVRHATVSALYPRVVQSNLGGTSVTFPSLKAHTLPCVVLRNRFRSAPSPYPDGTLLVYAKRTRLEDGTVELSGLNVVPPLSLVLCCGHLAQEDNNTPVENKPKTLPSGVPSLCRGWWDDDDDREGSPATIKINSVCVSDGCEVRIDQSVLFSSGKRLMKTLTILRNALNAYILNLLSVSRGATPITLPTQFADVLPAMLSTFQNSVAEAKYRNAMGSEELRCASVFEMSARAVCVYRVARAETPPPDHDLIPSSTNNSVLPFPSAPQQVDLATPCPKEIKVIEKTVELLLNKGTKAFEIEFRRKVSANKCFRFLLDYHPTYPYYTRHLRKMRQAREDAAAKAARLDPQTRAFLEAVRQSRESGEGGVVRTELPTDLTLTGPRILVKRLLPHVAAAFALLRRPCCLDGPAINVVLRYMHGDIRSRLLPSLFKNRRRFYPRWYQPLPAPVGFVLERMVEAAPLKEVQEQTESSLSKPPAQSRPWPNQKVPVPPARVEKTSKRERSPRRRVRSSSRDKVRKR